MISTLAALPGEILATLGMLVFLVLYIGWVYAGDAIFGQPGVGEKKRMTVVNERLRALGVFSLVVGAGALAVKHDPPVRYVFEPSFTTTHIS